MNERALRILAALAIIGAMIALHYAYETSGIWGGVLGAVAGFSVAQGVRWTIAAAALHTIDALDRAIEMRRKVSDQ